MVSNAQMIQPYDSQTTRRAEPLESLLVVVGLIVIMATFRDILLGGGQDDRISGNTLFQIVTLSIYGPGLFLLLLKIPGWLPKLMKISWPLLALLALATASALWSDAAAATLRRAIALSLTTSFAFYIVARFTLSEFLQLLAYAVGFYLLTGFVAAALPGVGITPHAPHTGSWRGFTGFKNEFGRICALIFAMACVLPFFVSGYWRRFALPLALASFLLLVLSTSKTSIVVALATIGGAVLLRVVFNPYVSRLRLGLDVRVAALAFILVSSVLFLAFGAAAIAEALGRDLTLSGRTKLWAYAFDLGLQRPWFGAGYRAFWTDANTMSFQALFYWDDAREGQAFNGPGNGHNGYLDTWLELGTVGIALLLTLFGNSLRRMRRCFARNAMAEGITLALLLSFLVTYSLTERVILEQTEGIWFLFMVFYLYAGRKLVDTSAGSGVNKSG